MIWSMPLIVNYMLVIITYEAFSQSIQTDAVKLTILNLP
jgi:hypothetical protein